MRAAWPESLPLLVRISATDWAEGGWDVDAVGGALRGRCATLGVDLVDVSSGGQVPHAKVPVGPGYQTAFAERIRREAGIATGAVGMILSPEQADHVDPDRPGGPGAARPGDAARPALPAPRGARAGARRALAEAVPPGAVAGGGTCALGSAHAHRPVRAVERGRRPLRGGRRGALRGGPPAALGASDCPRRAQPRGHRGAVPGGGGSRRPPRHPGGHRPRPALGSPAGGDLRGGARRGWGSTPAWPGSGSRART